jgi:hypothetical protein
MNAEHILLKWAARRGWDEATQKARLLAVVEELGEEGLSLLDRFLATAGAPPGRGAALAEWVAAEQEIREWFAGRPPDREAAGDSGGEVPE